MEDNKSVVTYKNGSEYPPYISKKTIRGKSLHYLSWAFAMRWLGSNYPHLQICFKPEIGDPETGYYVVGYIYNSLNGKMSAPMELAILDQKNDVMCSSNKNKRPGTNEEDGILNTHPLAQDICNTRQRARAKIVAIYLGMGAHLYEGFGDVLDENSKVNEEVKEQAQELVEENESIQDQIKSIKSFGKRLQDPELESYVNTKLINTMTSSELQKYSLSELSDFAKEQKEYYGLCRLKYLADLYKEKSGKEWAFQSEKTIEEMTFSELSKEGKKLKSAIDELDSPGTE